MGLREGAPPHLFMFVGINEEKVLHEANVRMMAQVVIVGITGLLAATIAWLFVSLVIVRPIRSLSLASQNVGRGQRGVRTDCPTTLTRSVNWPILSTRWRVFWM